MAIEKIEIQHVEANINTERIEPATIKNLNVFVEIVSNNHGKHFLQRMIPQGINPSILMLEIKVKPFDIFIFNPQRLTYSESLGTENLLNTVEIFADGKHLISIPVATTELINEVVKIEVNIQKSEPPKLHVSATGSVSSGSHFNAILIRRIYVIFPEDGIQEYDFLIDSPGGPQTTDVKLHTVIDVWDNFPDELKGARVFAKTNNIEMKL